MNLEFIQPPVQWAPAAVSPGSGANSPSFSNANAKNAWSGNYVPHTSSWRGVQVCADIVSPLPYTYITS